MLEDVQALRVRGHQSVFDSVVDHLDEMPRAGRTAMQITFFGGAAGFFAARSALRIATSWSQCFEDGIEMFDDVRFATDHLAVAALEPPDAAAGANVNVMQVLGGQFFRAADVINVVGIAAVNNYVACLKFAD